MASKDAPPLGPQPPIISRKHHLRIVSLFSPFYDCKSVPLDVANGVETRTIFSMFSAWILDFVKKNHGKFSSPRLLNNIYAKFCARKISHPTDEKALYLLAQQYQIPPCVLVRLLCQKFGDFLGSKKDSRSRRSVWNILKDPKEFIEDPFERENVAYCVQADMHFNPASECARMQSGCSGEARIAAFLLDRQIYSLNEKDLKRFGYPKTPDFLLSVPIAIRRSEKRNCPTWHVINWIESKASFATDAVHTKNLREQLWAYHNRFGPGLVIYWGGFVEELDVLAAEGIVLDVELPAAVQTIVCKF